MPVASKKSMRVLDVGCGFGGTVASLNERFSPIDLVGLNIDARQLKRARRKIKPAKGNKIKFVHGDACDLPFEDNSFDVVLAVECIFHFPDRAKFFREANRVLKPKGKFAFSDFVPSSKNASPLRFISNLLEWFVSRFYGKTSLKYTTEEYKKLAKDSHFKQILHKDITKETMPTYAVLLDLIRKYHRFPLIPYLSTSMIKWANQSGQTKYEILAYQKN